MHLQVHAAAQQQAVAQAQLAAQQQALLAQGAPTMLMQQPGSMLVQTAQGLMRVPAAAMQPQVISGQLAARLLVHQ